MMTNRASRTVMLIALSSFAAGTVVAAPAAKVDWQQQRVAAAEQTMAENAYRWQKQEQIRLEQQRQAQRQAAEQAKQQRLRERERSRERTGFSGYGSNTGGGGARMGGGKGGH